MLDIFCSLDGNGIWFKFELFSNFGSLGLTLLININEREEEFKTNSETLAVKSEI